MRLRKCSLLSLGGILLTACAGEVPTLGVHDGRLLPCPSSPNCISSQATDARHRIDPFPVTGSPETAVAQLKDVLARRPDATVVEVGNGYLRAELRTTFFVDDVEFLLDRAEGVIHIRSASRLGYSDFGKNRRRMEEIRRQFTGTSPTP